tara:strand:+ start:857 stop:1147 length:291 start_codon:yes stop_codon:yes gene_type:complete
MANTTGKKYGGRKKGTPNKTTQDMKSAILEAFDRAGGADYLTMLAVDEPRTFVTLLAKVLPNENVNENRNIDVNAMTERLQEGRDRVAKLRVVNGE